MRGMRKWKRWAVFLLLFVVLAVGGSRTAQAEMLDMTKYNNDLITVSKVPHGKAGNNIFHLKLIQIRLKKKELM